MKKISFSQVNFQQGPKESNSFYLPYSAGAIWSYAVTSEYVKNNFVLDKLLFKRDDVKSVAESLADNYLIGFSTYVWNKNYNYALAQEVKKINPNCICVFGGPELPITDVNIFKRLPFADIVVKKEGEKVFREILENYPNISNIKGLLINDDGAVIDTGNSERINDLSELPSPYTSGVFDSLVKNNPEVEWAATLETNRGCPYQCTFCDWGSLIYTKIKQFPIQKVYDEIEWICKNKCGFIFIADANFGIFPERDSKIIDRLIDRQKHYKFPYTFTVSWAKNQKEEVVDIASKLVEAGLFNNGLTISVQTMNEKVLDNIKRKNLNQHKIEEIFEICSQRQVPVTTEVILGLPGETLETWKKSIFDLFEAGNHSGVDITQVELLENAEMTQVQKTIYDLKTTTVYDYLGTNVDDYHEGIDVVTSTRHMPFDDMVKAQCFNTFINTFHIGGLTSIVSRFLHRYNDISYQEFYQDLYDFMYDIDWFQKEEKRVKHYFERWMIDGKLEHEDIGVEIHGYNLIYRTLVRLHREKLLSWVFENIKIFLDRYDLSIGLIDDLIALQQSYIVTYDDQTMYEEIDMKLDHDIWNYILGKELDTPIQYKLIFPEKRKLSEQMFIELLYYGRRRSFGKRQITIVETIDGQDLNSFETPIEIRT